MWYKYVSTGQLNFVQLLYTCCQYYQHYIIAGYTEDDNITDIWSTILQFKSLIQMTNTYANADNTLKP